MLTSSRCCHNCIGHNCIGHHCIGHNYILLLGADGQHTCQCARLCTCPLACLTQVLMDNTFVVRLGPDAPRGCSRQAAASALGNDTTSDIAVDQSLCVRKELATKVCSDHATSIHLNMRLDLWLHIAANQGLCAKKSGQPSHFDIVSLTQSGRLSWVHQIGSTKLGQASRLN